MKYAAIRVQSLGRCFFLKLVVDINCTRAPESPIRREYTLNYIGIVHMI